MHRTYGYLTLEKCPPRRASKFGFELMLVVGLAALIASAYAL